MAKEQKPKEPKEKKSKEQVKKTSQEAVVEKRDVPRVKILFKETVSKQLKERFSYKNVMQVPKLEKIVINVGIGKLMQQDSKILEIVTKELELITGQKIVITKAKKSISNFKLREGVPVGVMVTLRKDKMYEFFDRFVNLAVPRIRDFKGFSDKSFDGRGNYTVGIKEYVIFPEVDTDKISKLFGFDITFVTTAQSDEESYELLKFLGMPFVKKDVIVQNKIQ